jgi:hypothetical protein
VEHNLKELNRIAEVLSGAFTIGRCTNPIFIMKEKKNAKRTRDLRKTSRKTKEKRQEEEK